MRELLNKYGKLLNEIEKELPSKYGGEGEPDEGSAGGGGFNASDFACDSQCWQDYMAYDLFGIVLSMGGFDGVDYENEDIQAVIFDAIGNNGQLQQDTEEWMTLFGPDGTMNVDTSGGGTNVSGGANTSGGYEPGDGANMIPYFLINGTTQVMNDPSTAAQMISQVLENMCWWPESLTQQTAQSNPNSIIGQLYNNLSFPFYWCPDWVQQQMDDGSPWLSYDMTQEAWCEQYNPSIGGCGFPPSYYECMDTFAPTPISPTDPSIGCLDPTKSNYCESCEFHCHCMDSGNQNPNCPCSDSDVETSDGDTIDDLDFTPQPDLTTDPMLDTKPHSQLPKNIDKQLNEEINRIKRLM
tara:strand:+ start:3807 stop:4865 length:1059 start_codon:yes stop_codon:yes gene_type:complete